jgi:cobalt-zinc-cadmium efflux system membrane fusion protein
MIRADIPAAALVVLLAAGCSRREVPADPAPRDPSAGQIVVDSAQRSRFVIEQVDSSRYAPTILTTGTVVFSADRSTQVLAPISGPVSRLLVEPGARVTAGQALATVASSDFAGAVADLTKAQAVWRNARKIADRDEELFANDGISRRDVDQARTDLEEAAADRDAALVRLRALGADETAIASILSGTPMSVPLEAIIRAPIAGTVVEKLITPGQLLQAGGTPCFTIADLSTMWVMANVFEQDIRGVHAGERASILTEASPDTLTGRVDYVAALVDPATRATAVRIVVPNRGRLLERDMLVQVAIASATSHTGLLVPVAAVLRDDDDLPYVFRAAGDSAFGRRRITLGGRVGDRYVVSDGLTAGDRVVVNGAVFLQTMGAQ